MAVSGQTGALLGVRQVVGVDQFEKRQADQLGFLPSQQVCPGGVDRGDDAVESAAQHNVCRQQPESVPVCGTAGDFFFEPGVELAQPQESLGPFMLGAVPFAIGEHLLSHFRGQQQYAFIAAAFALHRREAVGPHGLFLVAVTPHHHRQVLDGETIACGEHLCHLGAEHRGDVGEHLRHRATERCRVPIAQCKAVGVVIKQPLLRAPVKGGDAFGIQYQRQAVRRDAGHEL